MSNLLLAQIFSVISVVLIVIVIFYTKYIIRHTKNALPKKPFPEVWKDRYKDCYKFNVGDTVCVIETSDSSWAWSPEKRTSIGCGLKVTQVFCDGTVMLSNGFLYAPNQIILIKKGELK